MVFGGFGIVEGFVVRVKVVGFGLFFLSLSFWMIFMCLLEKSF